MWGHVSVKTIYLFVMESTHLCSYGCRFIFGNMCVCVLLSVFVLNMLSYRNSYQLLHDLEIEDPAHGFLPLDIQWTFIR